MLSRAILYLLGTFRIHDDEHYRNFVRRMVSRPTDQTSAGSAPVSVSSSAEARARPRALITVSNHRSVLDDPGVLASVLPVRWLSE